MSSPFEPRTANPSPSRASTGAVRATSVEALFEAGPGVPRAVVDLRSPGEFAVDHVPGAVNVPLLDDEGRALVGLFYRQVSPDAAFERGLERVARRVEALVAEVCRIGGWERPDEDPEERVREMVRGGFWAFRESLERTEGVAPGPRSVVFGCWRGGMRSRAVVALLQALGLEGALALEGGYKAYRRWVRRVLDAWEPPPAVVLRGLTGVGKTLVLGAIERLRPGWTIDLEELAAHRSSLLGMVGRAPVSQKAFETRLVQRLRELGDGPLVLEGESRKVGDRVLPGPVWRALESGTHVELTAPDERRIDVLVADYLGDGAHRAELCTQLGVVGERLRPRVDLGAELDRGREREVAALLLERYYDPLYRHGERGRRISLSVDATDPGRAAREIVAWIEAGGAR